MARRIKKDEETEAYEWRGLVSYRRGAIRAIKRRTNKRERREGRAEAQDTTRPDMTPEGNESSPDDQRYLSHMLPAIRFAGGRSMHVVDRYAGLRWSADTQVWILVATASAVTT